jgi:hypothetical protein
MLDEGLGVVKLEDMIHIRAEGKRILTPDRGSSSRFKTPAGGILHPANQGKEVWSCSFWKSAGNKALRRSC